MATQAEDDMKTRIQMEKDIKIKMKRDRSNGLIGSMKIKNHGSSSTNKNEKSSFSGQVYWKFWMLERLSKFILSGERTVGTDNTDAVPVDCEKRKERRKKREEGEGEEMFRDSTLVATEVDDVITASRNVPLSSHSTVRKVEDERVSDRMRERAAVVKAVLSDIDTTHLSKPSFKYSKSSEYFDSKNIDLGPDSSPPAVHKDESSSSAMSTGQGLYFYYRDHYHFLSI